MMVSNCSILFGWCQIVLGVKLSQMSVLAIYCVELLPEYLFRIWAKWSKPSTRAKNIRKANGQSENRNLRPISYCTAEAKSAEKYLLRSG